MTDSPDLSYAIVLGSNIRSMRHRNLTIAAPEVSAMSAQTNHFEKYRLFYSPLVFFIIFVLCDTLAAWLFTHVAGTSWDKYYSAIATAKVKELSKNEKLYRIWHEIYHHDLKSSFSIDQTTWGPLIYPMNTNSLGFKDETTRGVSLTSERRRLLFMGDSFTEGLGVEYRDTFVGLIGAHYRDRGVEVLNAAVSSYSPIIYWRKVKNLLDKGFRFDELVVYIDISDTQDDGVMYALDENSNVIDYKKVHPREKLTHPGITDTELEGGSQVRRALETYTILTSKAFAYVEDLIFPRIGDTRGLNLQRAAWTFDKGIYEDYGKNGLVKSIKYMDRLADLVKSRNIRLTIAVYPWPDQILYDSVDSIQVRVWKKWAQERGVGFIDNFPLWLRDEPVSLDEKIRTINNYYISGDMRWTQAGHQLVAEHFLKSY